MLPGGCTRPLLARDGCARGCRRCAPRGNGHWAAALPASTRALGAWLVAGRALCASAELYLVGKHARALLATVDLVEMPAQL